MVVKITNVWIWKSPNPAFLSKSTITMPVQPCPEFQCRLIFRFGPRATVQSAAVSIALPNNQVKNRGDWILNLINMIKKIILVLAE